MRFVKMVLVTLAALTVSAAGVSAQTLIAPEFTPGDGARVFSFNRVGQSDSYEFRINDELFRVLNFSDDEPVQTFDIARRELRQFGVFGPGIIRANRDLQNNAFLVRDETIPDGERPRTALRVSLSQEFIDGTLGLYTPPVPRATFDFQRLTEKRYALSINDVFFRTVSFRDDDPQRFLLSRDELADRFGIAEDDQLSFLRRTFGTKIREFDLGFQVEISEARAGGFGDTLFFFEEVGFDRFQLYINGRKSWELQGILSGTDDASFFISHESFAARFGLTGDIFETFGLERGGNAQIVAGNPISITDLGNGTFEFIIPRNLFENGGREEVLNSVFLVVRNFLSPSQPTS